MKVRIVVLLSAPAGHLSVYHNTLAEAEAYIRGWRERTVARIKEGKPEIESSCIYDDRNGWAILAQYIIGMYIPEQNPTAQDRAAAALEKMVDSGEDWKSE